MQNINFMIYPYQNQDQMNLQEHKGTHGFAIMTYQSQCYDSCLLANTLSRFVLITETFFVLCSMVPVPNFENFESLWITYFQTNSTKFRNKKNITSLLQVKQRHIKSTNSSYTNKKSAVVVYWLYSIRFFKISL